MSAIVLERALIIHLRRINSIHGAARSDMRALIRHTVSAIRVARERAS